MKYERPAIHFAPAVSAPQAAGQPAAAGSAPHSLLRAAVVALLWSVWIALLAVSLAILVSAIIFGRPSLPSLVTGWAKSAVIVSTSSATFLWWSGYTLFLWRHKGALRLFDLLVPSVPMFVFVAVPVLLLYLSESANHFFYYSLVHPNQPRSLAMVLILVVAVVVLQSACLRTRGGPPFAQAIQLAATRLQDPLAVALLIALGVLQALAYLPNVGMDFLRYWSIADSFVAGTPSYPAMPSGDSYVAGGMTAYLIDLPFFPLLLAGAFAVFGHTTSASYVPIVLSNILLPPLMFLLFHELLKDQVLSLTFSSFVVLFSPFRFYTLNWPVPDATFVVLLIASAWSLARLMRGKGGLAHWIALATTGTLAALTRPEGIAYAVVFFALALSVRASAAHRLVASAVFFGPLLVFSTVMMLSFGMPWPRNWVGSLGIENIQANLPALISDPFLTSAIRMSTPQLVVWWSFLLAAALIGQWPGLHQPRRLAILFLPAWINIAAVYMVDPRVSGAGLWFDFFRHVSYAFPFLVLSASLALAAPLQLIQHPPLRLGARWLLALAVLAAVFWNLHQLSKPSWNFGPDAVNVVSQERLNFSDLAANPFELPQLTYRTSDGVTYPVFPTDFISKYPDPITLFYRPFDVVNAMSGTAYQTGSQLLFIAALLVIVLPDVLGAVGELCTRLRHRVRLAQAVS